MILKYKCIKFKSILIVSLLICIILFKIFSFINMIIPTNADSKWIEEFEADLKVGGSEKVTIPPFGDVRLALKTNIIRDDFIDESKISYKNNLTFDNSTFSVKLNVVPKTFGGIRNDSGRYIQQTTDGGFIITGITEVSEFEYDVLLLKTDNLLNEQWNRTFNWGKLDESWSICQTNDSGYIIVGDHEEQSHWAYRDIWLIKTNSTGVEQWNKSFDKSSFDYSSSVEQTIDGGYIIIGTSYNDYPAQNLTLIKTDNLGNEQWNQTFGGLDWDTSWAGGQTSDGGYFLLGDTYSYGGGNTSYGGATDVDIWFIKTNSSGNETWNRTYGGIEGEWGWSAQETTDGGFIILGSTWSFGNYLVEDFWLLKINSTGVEQWNRTFGGLQRDEPRSVFQTTDGGYIITGGTTSLGAGGYDVWVIKTDSSGVEEWNRTFGNSEDEIITSIQQSANGGFILTGWTESYGAGESDVLLIKLDKSGNYISEGMFGSIDLLGGNIVVSIDSFDYRSSIPMNTIIQVQFSQDNTSWYNATGVYGTWINLSNGINSIGLSKLNWQGPNFYYRVKFISNDFSVPNLQYIKLSYSIFESSGTLESKPFQIKGFATWKILSWESLEPPGTSIRFQLRSSNTQSGLTSKLYIGPEGKSENYYNSSGSVIWSGHSSELWMQYKVYLENIDKISTPVLYNVTLSFNYWPEPPIIIRPMNDTWTNNNEPTFNWQFNDTDSANQTAFEVQISKEYTFKNITYNSGIQQSAIGTWQFPTGTNYRELSDGVWYWKVRTKDDDGAWGHFCEPQKLKIDTTSPRSSITMPFNNGIYKNLTSIIGESFDPEFGIDINYSEISIERLDDHDYWTGSEWSINKTWLKVIGINQWNFDTKDINWNSNTEYEIRSRAVDQLKNIEFDDTGIIFRIDFDEPSSYITTPKNKIWINKLDIVSGSAIDTGGAGIKSVYLCIEQINESTYWDGRKWNSSETWLLTNGTTEWTYNSTEIIWITGYNYTINSKAIDKVENIKVSKNATFLTFDNVPPVINNITINNNSIQTNSTKVTLSINAQDSDSGLHLMTFSSDSVNWSSWEPFANFRDFTLPSNDGVKTVHCIIMDTAGNIAQIGSDSIILNTTKQIINSTLNEIELEDEEFLTPFIFIVTTLTVMVIIIGIFISGTEIGKYKFFSLIFLPLYNRLHPERIMDNFIRGKIIGYIEARPGVNYNKIKYALKLKNGTLTHHTQVLKREGFISILRDGTYTRFYSTGVLVNKSKILPLKMIQEELIDMIRHEPGITQHEIIELIGLGQKVISYNLLQLKRQDLIRVVPNGRENKYFISEEVEKSYQEQTKPEYDTCVNEEDASEVTWGPDDDSEVDWDPENEP